jgi:hypothetical protein
MLSILSFAQILLNAINIINMMLIPKKCRENAGVPKQM